MQCQYPKKRDQSDLHVFFAILCMITPQIIHSADESPTRIRRNSSLETIVPDFAAIQTATTQSPLHSQTNTHQEIQAVLSPQPLGCCALITQGVHQLKSEWNHSMPYFRQCTWPPSIDRSQVHPDIVKCNENIYTHVMGTFCCPCIIGYICCHRYWQALTEDSD